MIAFIYHLFWLSYSGTIVAHIWSKRGSFQKSRRRVTEDAEKCF